MNDLPKIFSKINMRIFELLITKPFSVRELAEKTDCSPAKVSTAAKYFAEQGLIKIRKEKNRKFIELNRQNILTKQIISLIFISKIINSETFKKMKEKAKAVGVYGSTADGTMDERSDVDLWLLSYKKLLMSELGEMRMHLSRELGREVSLKSFTSEELEKLKEKDEIFYSEISSKSKVLFGDALG